MRMNRIITGLLYFILTLGALGAFRAVWHTGFTVLWIWVVCVLAALVLGALPLYAISLYNHPYYDDYGFSAKAHQAWRDTGSVGAVLRAALIGADAVLLAKNVDGVYSADPKKDPDAVRFDSLTYEEVLEKRLAVMDSTATCIAMDNRIPIKVFALREPENILRAARGETVGTLVH